MSQKKAQKGQFHETPQGLAGVAAHARARNFRLEALPSTTSRPEAGNRQRSTFVQDAAKSMLPGGQANPLHAQIARRCAEAWDWLAAHLLIGRLPEDEYGWHGVTTLGLEIRNRAGLQKMLDEGDLPEEHLHPAYLVDVRPLFLQRRYDLAVFEAYKSPEVAIRDRACLTIADYGKEVAVKAFRVGGPLRDPAAQAAEEDGLMYLMMGAIASYKNSHSHRRVGLEAGEAREMIVLAAHLMRIVESRAPTNWQPE